MKNLLFILVMFLFLFEGTKAQRPITITDDSLSFGNSSMPAFSVVIPEVGYEETLKAWTKELQGGTKSKVVRGSDGLSIFGAKIRDVSDNPVNVYSSLNPGDSAVNMKVAIELEKDQFAGSPGTRDKAREYLMKFAKDQYISLVKDQLSAEKQELNKLERELNSLERDQKNMERSNRSNYEAISSEKGRLDALNNEVTSLSSEMVTDTSNSEVSGMGAPAPADPDRLKDVEKQLKKSRKDIKASEKRISKAEEEIDKNKREMPQNIELQNDARVKVTQQEAVVQKYEEKLETISNYR